MNIIYIDQNYFQ